MTFLCRHDGNYRVPLSMLDLTLGLPREFKSIQRQAAEIREIHWTNHPDPSIKRDSNDAKVIFDFLHARQKYSLRPLRSLREQTISSRRDAGCAEAFDTTNLANPLRALRPGESKFIKKRVRHV